jgi:hypothetical protein
MSEEFMEKLRQKGKDAHITQSYQLLGLEIAKILGDEKHKALYIKLAKEQGAERLLGVAKDIAQRTGVKNKGAYFMRVITEEKKGKK